MYDFSEVPPHILRLRKKLLPGLENYLSEGYDAVVLHSSSIIIAIDQATTNMFGYTDEEVVGANAWQFITPQSIEIIMQRLLQKSTEAYRAQAIRKDKTIFTVELKGRDFEVDDEPVRAVLLKQV